MIPALPLWLVWVVRNIGCGTKENSDCGWSYFLKEKLDIRDLVMSLLKDFKMKQGIGSRNIYCNYAGEYHALERL